MRIYKRPKYCMFVRTPPKCQPFTNNERQGSTFTYK